MRNGNLRIPLSILDVSGRGPLIKELRTAGGLLPGALCAPEAQIPIKFVLFLARMTPRGAFLYSAYKRDRGFHIGMWYKTILIACCSS